MVRSLCDSAPNRGRSIGLPLLALHDDLGRIERARSRREEKRPAHPSRQRSRTEMDLPARAIQRPTRSGARGETSARDGEGREDVTEPIEIKCDDHTWVKDQFGMWYC